MTRSDSAERSSQANTTIDAQRSPRDTPRVVVGIDGSWASRAALQWAARYARATSAALWAVRVLEWPIGFLADSSPRVNPTLHVPVSDIGRSYFDGMRRVFDEVAPLPGWRLTFAEGPTAEMLVEVATDAEVLVIGSREHTVSGRAASGNTSHYCISHSSGPVVVVPVEFLTRSLPPQYAPGRACHDLQRSEGKPSSVDVIGH